MPVALRAASQLSKVHGAVLNAHTYVGRDRYIPLMSRESIKWHPSLKELFFLNMPRNLQVGGGQVGRWGSMYLSYIYTLQQMYVTEVSLSYMSQQTLKDSYNSHKKQSVLLF